MGHMWSSTNFSEADHQTVDASRRRASACHSVLSSVLDLSQWPPELGLSVLSHLGATDLCLAACVWNQLGWDNALWLGLCRSRWGYVSIYRNTEGKQEYKDLYLLLDEATLTYNIDAIKGLDYLISKGLLENDATEIALFLHKSKKLSAVQTRRLLESRRDVLDVYMSIQDYSSKCITAALRGLFRRIAAPEGLGDFLHVLLDRFSRRYCNCNPSVTLTTDSVYILCYSLILLSVDLTSPHVKNKMSKREFIKNIQKALPVVGEDLSGQLYDDVYMKGHIAHPPAPRQVRLAWTVYT